MKALKLTAVALAVVTSFAAQAGINIVDNEKGNFNIGGNVEVNYDYKKLDDATHTNDKNADGRVLIDFNGTRNTAAGYYLSMKAQALMGMRSGVAVDDSWLSFGKKDSWDIRLGRFEGADMFPVGLDIFLEHSGNTGDGLVKDNQAYVYRMKEARGRSNSAGQAMYSQAFGNTRVEVMAMIGDRSDLFDGEKSKKKYHGELLKKGDNAVIIRPVITQTMGDFRLSAGLEANVVSDSMTRASDGKDISDRRGYGLTGTYQIEDFSFNTSVAYLDAFEEQDTTLGASFVFHNFGLGYIYAVNDFDSEAYYKGKVNVSTTYASYVFHDVLEVPEFRISLGAFATTQSADGKVGTGGTNAADFREDEDFGGRVRFNYDF